jgi:mono/diheme cytochrome c family protein
MKRRATIFVLAAFGIVAASGCERAMHDMYRQPRYQPMAGSALWPDGTSARPAVRGTVPAAAGPIAASSSGRAGHRNDPFAHVADEPLTRAIVERGRKRFAIFCVPCHGAAGDGDGIVPRRGFPHPPTFHSDALRQAADEHFVDVMTNGHGAMIAYGDRVAPADRRAIVAYIRALQLSQHAAIDDVPPAERARLEAAR